MNEESIEKFAIPGASGGHIFVIEFAGALPVEEPDAPPELPPPEPPPEFPPPEDGGGGLF